MSGKRRQPQQTTAFCRTCNAREQRAIVDGRCIVCGRNPALPAHQPVPGTVTDNQGQPCPAGHHRHYPLTATCRCGSTAPLRCADPTADWTHEAVAS